MIKEQFVEIILGVWIGVILIIGVLNREKLKEMKILNFLYSITILLLSFLSIQLVKELIYGEVVKNELFYGLLEVNNFVYILKILAIITVIMIVLMSRDYLKKESLYSIEYLSLLLFVLLAMFYILGSVDLVLIYMALELQGLSLYVLAAYNVMSIKSTEAGLKYFVTGSIASIIYLIGVGILYFEYGSINLDELSLLINYQIEDKLALIGICLILSGLFIKIAVAPFHVWIADVYEGVITVVTAFFIIVPKIVLVALILKIVIMFDKIFVNIWYMDLILIIMALLSGMIGTLAALYQQSIKRLLAYSSIVHMAFIVLGIVIGSVLSYVYIILYMVIYVLASINMFAIILGIRNESVNREIETIREFSGLIRNNKALTLLMVLSFFSLVGIPPLAGFYGKALILSVVMEVNLFYIALIFVLFSSISAFYYLRLVKVSVYSQVENWVLYSNMTKELSYVISFVFLLNLLFVLFFNDILVILMNSI